MSNVDIKELFEAGCHFGHAKKNWNPKMEQFIYSDNNSKKKDHIIDLVKTASKLSEALGVINNVVQRGGKILFVGTKKQATKAIEKLGQDTEMFYVAERWLGGMLTNNDTITGSIKRLEEIEKMKETGVYEQLTKKEVLSLEKKRDSLLKVLEGIRNMKKMPDLLFIVDPVKEGIALKEAKTLGIPVVAIADTNANPDEVDYIIPSNNDGVKAVTLILSIVEKEILENKKAVKNVDAEQGEEVVEE